MVKRLFAGNSGFGDAARSPESQSIVHRAGVNPTTILSPPVKSRLALVAGSRAFVGSRLSLTITLTDDSVASADPESQPFPWRPRSLPNLPPHSFHLPLESRRNQSPVWKVGKLHLSVRLMKAQVVEEIYEQ